MRLARALRELVSLALDVEHTHADLDGRRVTDRATLCGDGGAVIPATARAGAVRRARWLNGATIGWNTAEGLVAVGAGLAAGSVSLLGFGFDSAIEVSAALILAWRLHQERLGGCTQESDRWATRAIALSFVALALYVGVESVRDLTTGARPEASAVGVALASVSLVVQRRPLPKPLRAEPFTPQGSGRPRSS